MEVGGRNIVISGRFIRTARVDGDGFRFIQDPERILTGLQACGQRVDLFTFIQAVSDSSPRYKYPMEWDNVAAIELKSFDHWWTEQIGFKARNKAKQAEKKGVTLREISFDESLARGIWEIYNESPIRQGRKFFNYGKTLDRVRREASTFLDCSIFIGAFFEDKLIGFTKLTIDETGAQAGLMHIISMIEHRDKAPTNALIAHSVRACTDRGIRYLVYANFAYGKKTHDSLSDFKERNGFRRIDVPRYYAPCTPLGSMALRLGLHLDLHHHLPEAVISVYRRYRAAWYSRKYGLASGSGTSSSRVVTEG